MAREIAATIPEEPPPGSVVLTRKGLAYQREPDDPNLLMQMFGGLPLARWWPARDAANAFGSVAMSWPFLAAQGPVLLLTDTEQVQTWLDRQEATR